MCKYIVSGGPRNVESTQKNYFRGVWWDFRRGTYSDLKIERA